MEFWQIKKVFENEEKYNSIKEAILIDCDNIIQDYQIFPDSVHLLNAINVKNKIIESNYVCIFIEILVNHNFYLEPYLHEENLEINGPQNKFKFIQAKHVVESFILI